MALQQSKANFQQPEVAPSRTQQPRYNPFTFLLRVFGVRRQRQALAALDARLLNDIGVTPKQAANEIAKPFWKF